MIHFWKFYQETKQNETRRQEEAHQSRPSVFAKLSIFPTAHAITNKRMKEMYDEYQEYLEYKAEEDPENKLTGSQRLRNMWYGILWEDAWEFRFLNDTFIYGLFLGAFLGVFVDSKIMTREYTKRFNEMAFEGEYHARRKLTDYTMLQTCVNAGSRAMKMSLMPTYFGAFALSSITYRNEIVSLDFSLASAFAAALYRFPLGPRASLTAAGVMSIFGLAVGYIAKGAFWYTGTSVAEFRYICKMREMRNKYEFSTHSWNQWRKQVQEPMEQELYDRDLLIKEMKNESKKQIIHESFFEKEPTPVTTIDKK